MSISLKKLHIFILLISITSLLGAYFVEYVMKLTACPLCIYQRFPYLLLLFAAIVGLANDESQKKYYILIFLCSIILASYHSGVERGVFEMSAFCKPLVTINDNFSVSDFKNLLYNEKLGMCNKPALIIFGLSMAEWNLVLNIALLFLVSIIKFKSDESHA